MSLVPYYFLSRKGVNKIPKDLKDLATYDLSPIKTLGLQLGDKNSKLNRDVVPPDKIPLLNIVLDLDHTLVHVVEAPIINKSTVCTPIKVNFQSLSSNQDQEMYVYLRPGIEEFLQFVTEHYNVGIWSVGQPDYVATIAKLLKLGTQYRVNFIYNWTNCKRKNFKISKPIQDSPFKDEPSIIIEDTIDFCEPEDKYIIVPRFKATDINDKILYTLCDLLA